VSKFPQWLTFSGSVITAFGVWFWYTENSYAAENNSGLASTLQWVGFAQALTGIAVVFIARTTRRLET
jgi:hypothetical protein